MRAYQTEALTHEIATGMEIEIVPLIAKTWRISTNSWTSIAKFPNRFAKILRCSTNGNLWTATRHFAIFFGTIREFANRYSGTQTPSSGMRRDTTGTRIVPTPMRIEQIATAI